MSEIWPMVHAERWALIKDLARLDERQWSQPSLCEGWTVHDVAAHLVDNARTTPLRIVWAMARARFDFDRQNDQGMKRERGANPAATLARLRHVAERTSGPPASLDSRLVEEVVHREDIRRPLGLSRSYPTGAVVRALQYQARTSVALGGAKQRVAGVRLRASDVEVTIGEGPEVAGPALSLLMAISGRGIARGELSGEGVAVMG